MRWSRGVRTRARCNHARLSAFGNPRVGQVSDPNDKGELKAAELLSTAGAAVLGAGLALLWPRLADFAIPLVAIGLVAHATGMVLKQQLQRGQPQPRWSRTLVLTCWLAMAGLVVGLGWRVMNG
jgi:hypothetical protein